MSKQSDEAFKIYPFPSAERLAELEDEMGDFPHEMGRLRLQDVIRILNRDLPGDKDPTKQP